MHASLAPWDSTPVANDRSDSAVAGRRRAYLVVLAGYNAGEMLRVDQEVRVGRGEEATLRVLDTEISRLHARVVRDGGRLWVEDLGSTNGTFVNGVPVLDARELRDGDKIHLGSTLLLRLSYHDELEARFQQQLYDAALRDGLTRAYNRRYFEERLEQEVAYSRRHGTGVTLLMLDVDHFKPINDTYGHLVGDQVLAELVRRIRGKVRREDVIARYGGEEFALLGRGIDEAGGLILAERLRHAVLRAPFEHRGASIHVTASVGVVTCVAGGTINAEALLTSADRALYAAKGAGRNRVVAAPVPGG